MTSQEEDWRRSDDVLDQVREFAAAVVVDDESFELGFGERGCRVRVWRQGGVAPQK